MANPEAIGKFWLCAGALVFCSEDDLHSLTASTRRYRTPPHLIIIKSMGILRAISAKPWSNKESQTRSPATTPRQNQNALTPPPSNVVATTAASPGPGVAAAIPRAVRKTKNQESAAFTIPQIVCDCLRLSDPTHKFLSFFQSR